MFIVKLLGEPQILSGCSGEDKISASTGNRTPVHSSRVIELSLKCLLFLVCTQYKNNRLTAM